MKGLTLDFKQKVQTDTDEFNNPTYTIIGLTVSDCLVAPITEPATAREQQAVDQSKDQVRVHLPKTFSDDIGGSYFAWDGKIFQVDSSSVKFMDDNTPTRWNRYFRGESVGRFDDNVDDVWLHFFVTEDSNYHLAPEQP